MTISELITVLESIRKQHGDVEVRRFDDYTANAGWGGMKVWHRVDKEEIGYHEDVPLTLDESGDLFSFVGI